MYCVNPITYVQVKCVLRHLESYAEIIVNDIINDPKWFQRKVCNPTL